MFAPHNRENSKFGKIWFAPENFLDPLELLGRQSMLLDQGGCNDRIGGGRLAAHRQVTLTYPNAGSIAQDKSAV
jgi:hypothetical protein